MHDKISVIVPSLNENHQLYQLEKHIFSSAVNPEFVELIICDALLSKEEIKYVPFHTNTKLVVSEKKCRASQLNLGAKHAKGKILLFCHADVRLPLEYDKEIRGTISRGFKMGFFKYVFDPSNKLLDINASQTGKRGIFAGGGDQCQFFKKEFFEQLNGYDEKFVIMEDFDLIRRVKKAGMPFEIIQKPAIVSARKYEKNSYLKVNLANLMAFTMFHLNVSPAKIFKFYKSVLN